MDPRRITRSPALAPATAIFAIALLLGANPARRQVVESLLGSLPDPVRLIPLAPDAAIPTWFAKWLWSCAVLAGSAWLVLSGVKGEAVRRDNVSSAIPWRTLAYGFSSLSAVAALGLVFWTTTMQWWGAFHWFSDAAQGWFLLAFVFAYAWAVVVAIVFWRRDVERRCPQCLGRLCMPMETGRESSVLIDTGGVEFICLRGHGTMAQTRWGRSFRPVAGFWKQLLK